MTILLNISNNQTPGHLSGVSPKNHAPCLVLGLEGCRGREKLWVLAPQNGLPILVFLPTIVDALSMANQSVPAHHAQLPTISDTSLRASHQWKKWSLSHYSHVCLLICLVRQANRCQCCIELRNHTQLQHSPGCVRHAAYHATSSSCFASGCFSEQWSPKTVGFLLVSLTTEHKGVYHFEKSLSLTFLCACAAASKAGVSSRALARVWPF